MPHVPLSIDVSTPLIVAAVAGIAAMAVAVIRRIILPKTSMALAAAGIVCLALAAGNLRWDASPPRSVAVMVDLSASTRTATYHDRAALAHRLDQLLDRTPYTLYAFAEQSTPAAVAHLPSEMPGERTIFDPPPADAVVLFSDARFPLPKSAPPTYVVIDPALEHVADGAVTFLRARGREISAGVNNGSDDSRQLAFTHAAPTTQLAPAGDTVLTGELSPDASETSATLVQADPWPENDALSVRVAPPTTLERWWITASPSRDAPPGWRVLTQSALSDDDAAYLHTSVIAFDNIPADQITRFNRERLEQFVRDLGGGLLILGGDHAFAAGGYAGTALERLSPLASNPPAPATRWVLLVDSSGSMAASIGDNSRWNFAVYAMMNLVPLLPAKDAVDIGDFARNVRWWATSTPAERLDLPHLVPDDAHPTGPTNLQPVLEQLARSSDGNAPTQTIIVTDAEASIDNADALAAELAKKRVHVNVLSLVPPPAKSSLGQLIKQTGGLNLAENDPRQWSARLRQLLRSTAPPWLNTAPLAIHFTPAGPQLPAQNASPWNQTWLKPNATELASGQSESGESVPAVAAWNIGAGAVLSTAFRPSPAIADALSAVVAMPPRDPRFSVAWDTGKEFSVTVDAVDGSHFLNGLKFSLTLSTGDSSVQTFSIPQVGPGRYALSIPAPRRRGIARLMLDDRILDRIAVADRYAPEFDAVGNDRPAMRALADQTGGEIIEPNRVTPIEFPRRPIHSIPLTTPLAFLGAALMAGALIRWRLG